MIQSGGLVVKRPDIVEWRGTTSNIPDYIADAIGCGYGSMYRRQLWVYVVVSKRAGAVARLPLKTYRKEAGSRVDASDSPYGTLLARPNTKIPPVVFWRWVQSTVDVYGEAFLGKARDRGGRPVELVPMHPTSVQFDEQRGWSYDDGKRRLDNIPRRDLVHFRDYNPDSFVRGMSPLEPLRATLENEAGARAANLALWRNGGRPSMFIRHPKKLTEPAAERLSMQWADIHGSVDNWAKTAILEEGMEAQLLNLNVEELQYIEARKLNREEVCAAYDVPPPVVHILDRATFSNITEQMRSMYRDTMAPVLGLIEATLDMELRDGSMGTANLPDFADDLYAEFLLDEVLRGDFEVRAQAYSTAINSGWMEPAEVRAKENLPFVEGSDVLLQNSTLVPVNSVEEGMTPRELSEALQKIYVSVGKVISGDEAREILNRGGAGLVGPAPEWAPPGDDTPKGIGPHSLRTIMGRLGRAKSLADLDPVSFSAGLNGDASTVTEAYVHALAVGESIGQFKSRLKTMAVRDEPADAVAPTINVHEAPVTVNVEKAASPVVNVAPAEVTVTTPDVHNTFQMDAPVVNVNVARRTVRTVERDELGRIARVIDDEVTDG